MSKRLLDPLHFQLVFLGAVLAMWSVGCASGPCACGKSDDASTFHSRDHDVYVGAREAGGLVKFEDLIAATPDPVLLKSTKVISRKRIK